MQLGSKFENKGTGGTKEARTLHIWWGFVEQPKVISSFEFSFSILCPMITSAQRYFTVKSGAFSSTLLSKTIVAGSSASQLVI